MSPTCASLFDSTSRRKRSILAYVGAYASSNSRGVRGDRVAGPGVCEYGFPTDATLPLARVPVRLLPSCLVLDALGLEAAEGAFGRVDCDGDMGDFACRGVAFGEMCRAGRRGGGLDSVMGPGLMDEPGSCSPGSKGPLSRDSLRTIFARMNGVMPYTGSGDVELAGVGK